MGNKKNTKAAVKTVKQQIKSITPRTGALANPNAYNKALAVLQSAGKTKKAEKLAAKAKKEIKADTKKGIAKGFLEKPTPTPTPGPGPGQGTPPGQEYNIQDDPAYQSLLERLGESELYGEGLEEQLGGLGSQLGGLQEQLEALRSSRAEQTGSDYQPTADISTSTTTEEFEPFSRDLFTSLLNELESSKKRQKDWDYEQALKAYKF